MELLETLGGLHLALPHFLSKQQRGLKDSGSFQSGTELLQTPHGCPGDEMMEKLLCNSILIFPPKEEANQELSEGEDVKAIRYKRDNQENLQH